MGAMAKAKDFKFYVHWLALYEVLANGRQSISQMGVITRFFKCSWPQSLSLKRLKLYSRQILYTSRPY